MNCKPGDLAIVVKSRREENIGALVKVLYRHIPGAPLGGTYSAFGRTWHHGRDVPMWVVEVCGRPLIAEKTGNADRVRPWADDCLRPIRDPGEDARDEMLRPLPQEIST